MSSYDLQSCNNILLADHWFDICFWLCPTEIFLLRSLNHYFNSMILNLNFDMIHSIKVANISKIQQVFPKIKLHINVGTIIPDTNTNSNNIVSLHVDYEYCPRCQFSISEYTNLTKLSIYSSLFIPELKKLTKISNLDFFNNNKISDTDISHLTKLSELTIGRNKSITDKGLSVHTNLKKLHLYRNKITSLGIRELTNLISLKIEYNLYIKDDALFLLSNLTQLHIVYSPEITNAGIEKLINLRDLKLIGNININDNGIKKLTNISTLFINNNTTITEKGLKKLINITDLTIINSTIEGTVLNSLTNIRVLHIGLRHNVISENIQNLSNLIYLTCDDYVLTHNIRQMPNVQYINYKKKQQA